MWKDLTKDRTPATVGELIDILSKLPKDYNISASGGDCHILINEAEKMMVFDEKDYSEEWNEDEMMITPDEENYPEKWNEDELIFI